MKIVTLLALSAGLAGTILLAGHIGFNALGHSIAAIGWAGFLAVIAAHLFVTAICGLAWFVLPPAPRPGPAAFTGARLIRAGAGDILPLAQLGGFAIGMRAIALAGLPAALSVASVMVDATLEMLSQIAFIILALALLLLLRPGSNLALPFAAGLAIVAAVAVLWLLAQRRGFRFARLITDRLAKRWKHTIAAGIASVGETIDGLYRRRPALGAGFVLHLAAWLLGALEIWLALQIAGIPLGVGPVLAIEGLLSAARGAAFFVPGAIGVQEGAYVLLGSAFGLTAETALALSLLKRARDVSLGLPALLVWQWVETGRLWRRAMPQP